MQLEEIKKHIIKNYCKFTKNDAVLNYKNLIAYLENLDYNFEEYDIYELLSENKIYKLVNYIFTNKLNKEKSKIHSLIYDVYLLTNNFNQMESMSVENNSNYINNEIEKEIKSIKVLTAEEEMALFEKIKSGDTEAEKLLAYHNIRLVYKVAGKYPKNTMFQFDDYVSEGTLGLMKAIEKFDPDKGFKFSTYAYWWIRQAITRAIADKSKTIRMPVHQYEKRNKILDYSEEFFRKHERYPSVEEISHNLKISIDIVKAILKNEQTLSSLDKPVGDDEDSDIKELIMDDSNLSIEASYENKNLINFINDVMLEGLSDKEKYILRGRWGILDGNGKYTLEELGETLGVTRERIRQIESKAIKKIIGTDKVYQVLDYFDSLSLEKRKEILSLHDLYVQKNTKFNTYHEKFYEYLKRYNINIDDFLENLSNEDIKTLGEYYNNGFYNIPTINVSMKKELKYFYYIRERLISRYIRLYKKDDINLFDSNKLSLMEYFSSRKIDINDVVINNEEREILLNYYGNGLDKRPTRKLDEKLFALRTRIIFEYKRDEKRHIGEHKNKINKNLGANEKVIQKNKNGKKKFIDWLEDNNITTQFLISNTKKKDIDLLEKAFGNDYNNFISKSLSKEEKQKIYMIKHKLLKLSKGENNMAYTNFFSYFKNSSEEEVRKVLYSLPMETQGIVFTRFQKGLDNPPVELPSKKELWRFYAVVKKMKNKLQEGNVDTIPKKDEPESEENQGIFDMYDDQILDDKPLTEEKDDSSTRINLLDMIKIPDKKEVLDTLTDEELIIATLKLGYNGKIYTDKEISKFLNVEETEIIEITKKVLLTYKKIFNENIDKEINKYTRKRNENKN